MTMAIATHTRNGLAWRNFFESGVEASLRVLALVVAREKLLALFCELAKAFLEVSKFLAAAMKFVVLGG